jgi:hypothetical protein
MPVRGFDFVSAIRRVTVLTEAGAERCAVAPACLLVVIVKIGNIGGIRKSSQVNSGMRRYELGNRGKLGGSAGLGKRETSGRSWNRPNSGAHERGETLAASGRASV